MRNAKKIFLTLILTVLAAYSLFFTPTADARYYGYSYAGNGNNHSYNAYYASNYNDPYYNYGDVNSNYYWPDDNDWLSNSNWLNSRYWSNQNDWFNTRYNYFNQTGYYNNSDYAYYYPNSNSSVWRSSYNSGNRRVMWNRSNRPVMNLNNYYGRYRYAGSYGYGNVVSPAYANAIAIVDRSNPNNAIVILNTGDYMDSGLSNITRASIMVNSNLFNELSSMIDNYGSNCNLDLDCRNNSLRYDGGYGSQTAGIYFRGVL